VDISKLPSPVGQDRRRFLGSRRGAVAAAQLSLADTGTARAATRGTPSAPVAGTPSGPVRQVKAGVLDTGYVEAGPADGPAVVLMHGFPYDIHSYARSPRCWRPRGTG
jgi:hypothetical protein